MMKLFNIPWATANRGILRKLYILFVYVEGNTRRVWGYMYVFDSLEVRIVKNRDRGLENVRVHMNVVPRSTENANSGTQN